LGDFIILRRNRTKIISLQEEIEDTRGVIRIMVNRRRTDNIMNKRKRTDNTMNKEKGQTTIHKTLHIKLITE
jgi:hypothetical protein